MGYLRLVHSAPPVPVPEGTCLAAFDGELDYIFATLKRLGAARGSGTTIFFQNEMPYDPPSQSAWMEAPGVDGYAAFKVNRNVTSFKGYGIGGYSFFNQGINIYAANAFEVPATLPAGSLQDLLTIFLNGSGGILNVINNTGGSATNANPDAPVTVVSYP